MAHHPDCVHIFSASLSLSLNLAIARFFASGYRRGYKVFGRLSDSDGVKSDYALDDSPLSALALTLTIEAALLLVYC